MSQLVGRVPGFIFVPPHPVFFGTSLVLAPTSRSVETVYFRTPSHLPGSSLHAKKSNQPISTPNEAVGSLVRFIFVPPTMVLFGTCSHPPVLSGFFRRFFIRPLPQVGQTQRLFGNTMNSHMVIDFFFGNLTNEW